MKESLTPDERVYESSEQLLLVKAEIIGEGAATHLRAAMRLYDCAENTILAKCAHSKQHKAGKRSARSADCCGHG